MILRVGREKTFKEIAKSDLLKAELLRRQKKAFVSFIG
jgi:hypothetical protein